MTGAVLYHYNTFHIIMIPGSKYNLPRQERSRQKTGTYAGVGKVSLGNGKRWTMNQILLLTGIVIVICILSGRLIDKLGVPSLLAFILLGMCFGVDGIFKISFQCTFTACAIRQNTVKFTIHKFQISRFNLLKPLQIPAR